MVLSSFLYLQFALALIGMGTVWFLHTRRLRQDAHMLLEAWTTARTESDAAHSDESHLAWLGARGAALEPKDPQGQIRKVILENEGKDPKRLNGLLKPFLGTPGLKEQWAEVRSQQHAAVVEIVAGNPSRAKTAMEVFAQYASFDKAFDFTAPEWPELPENTVDEVESLQAELAAVKAELESVTAGTDEDLRKLLKQFTQDSREMMGCIQQLEKENQALKSQLAQAAA